ncbi:MAG TPA: CHAT domain-containing protein, partial [Thermoanaerobaculia bacterium]|nr:CHAT domain-containing protein [Thermoanaerobaculia bacterium]
RQAPRHLDRLRTEGDTLFRALFQGEVRSRFDESLGAVQAFPGRGLRLRLRFDLRDPGLAALYDLPWELLYRRETGDFLSLRPATPVIRHLDAARPNRSEAWPATWRILVVASSAGTRRLNLRREIHNLRQALRGQSHVEAVFLQPATVEAFYQALRREPFHVLHFMGHGVLDAAAEEGSLVFEDEAGGAQRLRGEVLATMVSPFRDLRLVVLNACHGADAAGEGRAFTGVATALGMSGIPAVLAMRSRISDRAAVAFSKAFYSDLVAGATVEQATTEGRRAVYLLEESGAEWATPVLFQRGDQPQSYPGLTEGERHVSPGAPVRAPEAPPAQGSGLSEGPGCLRLSGFILLNLSVSITYLFFHTLTALGIIINSKPYRDSWLALQQEMDAYANPIEPWDLTVLLGFSCGYILLFVLSVKMGLRKGLTSGIYAAILGTFAVTLLNTFWQMMFFKESLVQTPWLISGFSTTVQMMFFTWLLDLALKKARSSFRRRSGD